eukprot:TRINITY_DN7436_c0_g1_i1.p1 TRINITY_DN7436_c0_g1~~TRINITY_DN7436_c0_g1_i1.p1  ORF type:complete len:420 (-),score=74.57 TRINITY_DN7436_c0_g1_i1:161-1342(-)
MSSVYTRSFGYSFIVTIIASSLLVALSVACCFIHSSANIAAPEACHGQYALVLHTPPRLSVFRHINALSRNIISLLLFLAICVLYLLGLSTPSWQLINLSGQHSHIMVGQIEYCDQWGSFFTACSYIDANLCSKTDEDIWPLVSLSCRELNISRAFIVLAIFFALLSFLLMLLYWFRSNESQIIKKTVKVFLITSTVCAFASLLGFIYFGKEMKPRETRSALVESRSFGYGFILTIISASLCLFLAWIIHYLPRPIFVNTITPIAASAAQDTQLVTVSTSVNNTNGAFMQIGSNTTIPNDPFTNTPNPTDNNDEDERELMMSLGPVPSAVVDDDENSQIDFALSSTSGDTAFSSASATDVSSSLSSADSVGITFSSSSASTTLSASDENASRS